MGKVGPRDKVGLYACWRVWRFCSSRFLQNCGQQQAREERRRQAGGDSEEDDSKVGGRWKHLF